MIQVSGVKRVRACACNNQRGVHEDVDEKSQCRTRSLLNEFVGQGTSSETTLTRQRTQLDVVVFGIWLKLLAHSPVRPGQSLPPI
jgi:hypothetical protein